MDPDMFPSAPKSRSRRPRLEGPDLFTPISRASDPQSSQDAAAAVAPMLSKCRARVLSAIERHGPICAEDLERLPELRDMKFSTARKRASDLALARQIATELKQHPNSGRRVTYYNRLSR